MWKSNSHLKPHISNTELLIPTSTQTHTTKFSSFQWRDNLVGCQTKKCGITVNDSSLLYLVQSNYTSIHYTLLTSPMVDTGFSISLCLECDCAFLISTFTALSPFQFPRMPSQQGQPYFGGGRGSTGVWMQGLTLTRKMLYHLSHSTSPNYSL
jgi:hypothetical protein